MEDKQLIMSLNVFAIMKSGVGAIVAQLVMLAY